MKAMFVISPYFKTIIEIPKITPDYYFALMLNDRKLILMEQGYPNAQPSTIRKMKFEYYKTDCISFGDKMEVVPIYELVNIY